VRASKISEEICASSATGLRATPPVVPECWSVAAVSSESVIGCSPRSPADTAGRPRDTHTVSETTTASVAAAGPIARSVSAKCGEPTSYSSSQRTLMFTGTPASSAARTP